MHTNAYQDWRHDYSNILVVFLGKQCLKIVDGLMPIIIKKDPHTNSRNFVGGEVVYFRNSNDFMKFSILLHNSANPSEEFVGANYLIYLIKLFIISLILILLKCFKYTHVVLTLLLVCNNMRSKTGNNTGHDLSSYAS